MADPAGVKPLTLDPEVTNAGAMERLFLLEATTPGMLGYVAAENLPAMRLMRQTIENRLKFPLEYGARGATSEIEIVELGGQFAGFDGYPTLDADMSYNLRLFLRIASQMRDRRQPVYAQFVRDAVVAATEAVSPVPKYANVTAWRTAGASSPGPRFRLLTTLSGNDFYAADPVPPMPRNARHGHRRPKAGPTQ